MVEIVVVAVVAAVAALVLFVARRPDRFTVERSVVIAAAPQTLYAKAADLGAFQSWSPWAKRDPAMRKSFSGPTSGVGATYAWEGNKDVGKGEMEIVEAVPDRRLAIRLSFEKPFKAENRTEFHFEPTDGGTRVRWVLTGPQPFMMKAMSLFMSMETMIGPDFEKGLAELKRQSEG